MHNFYSYQKSQKNLQKNKEDLLKATRQLVTRSKSKEHLVKNYKKRVEALINNLPKSLCQKPEISSQVPLTPFYTKYSSERERVQTSESKNKWFDTTPTPKSKYILRTRNRSKELSSEFHYSPFHSAKRRKSSQRVRSEKSIITGKTFQSFLALGVITHEINN